MYRTFTNWYKDETCSVSIEEMDHLTFIHCTIYKWTRSNITKFFEIFTAVCAELVDTGVHTLYTYSDVADRKFDKFCKMFGFTFLGTANNGWAVYKQEI